MANWQAWLTGLWARARYALVVLALLVQGFHAYMTGPAYQHDSGQQDGAVWALLEGKGVSQKVAKNPADLNAIAYEGVTWWSPVKTLALAPLMGLTGGSLWWAAMWLVWLFLALWMIGAFLLLEAFAPLIPSWVRALIWLTWIFTSVPTSNDTNMMAFAGFTLALAASAWCVRLNRPSWAWAVAIGAGLGVSVAMRYAYYAYLPLLPLAFVIYGALERQRAWWRVAAGALVVGGLSAVLVWLYNLALTGAILPHIAAQTESVRYTGRINWEHLLRFHPFPTDAIGAHPVRYWLSQVGLGGVAVALLWGMALVLLGAQARLTWQAWRATPDTGEEAELRLQRFFWLAGALVVSATVALFSYLSLRYAPEVNGWTQVSDPRYFAQTWLFTLVAVAMLLGGYGRWRTLRAAVVLCVVVAVAFGALNRVGNVRAYLRDGFTMGGLRTEDGTLRDHMRQAQAQGLEAVAFFAVHSDYATYTRAEANLADAVVYHGDFFDGMTLGVSKPTRVFLVVPPEYAQDGRTPRARVLRAWIDDLYGAQALPRAPLHAEVYTFDLMP